MVSMSKKTPLKKKKNRKNSSGDKQVIRKLKKELFEAKKTSALGLMTSRIVHEINNPLSVIGTHVELVECLMNASSPDKEQVLNSLRTINSVIARIQSIIASTKNISQRKKLSPTEAYPLEVIVNSNLTFIDSELKQYDIQLSQSHENSKEKIVCSPIEFSQVILNLLNNSIHAIREKSEKWIKINSKLTPKFVEFRITDSGNGIPKNIQKKLFTPYFTTKEIGLGTGIGLNLSKEIMKGFKGSLEYDNKDTKNTTFLIKIPRINA